MTVRPPRGAPPPACADVAGEAFDLLAPADEIARRYFDEFPDELERYGHSGVEWCRHDSRWVLQWAIDDADGPGYLDDQVSWLARVLHARDFPVGRLVRSLLITADVVAEGAFGDASAAAAGRLRAASQTVAELALGDPVEPR